LFEHPVLAAFYHRHGPAPFPPNPFPERTLFQVLAESIVAQQLSGKAAATLTARLWSRVPPEPLAVQALPLEALRRVGLSQTKALALQDLAEKTRQGLLEGIQLLPDEEVKARLLRVRGVGPWTAEMFLMFGLGRPDVWPVGDLGMQKAARALFGVAREDLPRFGEAFRPYRSHLAWYLWRSLE
jgi:DNA-3-methyladenine glycosylase II